MATYSRKVLSTKQLSQMPQNINMVKIAVYLLMLQFKLKHTGTSFDFRKLKTIIQICINVIAMI